MFDGWNLSAVNTIFRKAGDLAILGSGGDDYTLVSLRVAKFKLCGIIEKFSFMIVERRCPTIDRMFSELQSG